MLNARYIPSLPLLAKELLEISARKRTYVLRCVFATMLFIGFAVAYVSASSRSSRALDMLGTGAPIFEFLFVALFIGIAFFMPAITAGTITSEKEQGTLVLLMLTPMRPWELVAQKYLSRLIAMGGFLLLALPLFAVALSLGGIDEDSMWAGLYLLVVTLLQVGAVSIAVSAWCRGSTMAFFLSYVVVATMYLGIPLIGEVLRNSSMYGRSYGNGLLTGTILDVEHWQFICPAFLFDARPDGRVLLASVPAWISVAAFLLIARFALIRRAALTGANPLLRCFRWLDHAFNRIDRRMGRKVAVDLPAMDPVAWREVNRRSLANVRYLVRIFLPVHVCLFFLLVGMGTNQVGGDGYAVLSCVLLSLSVLVLVVMGAGVVATERSQQTLEVLLTTPMSARDIVRQKVRALTRMRWVLTVLLLEILVFRLLVETRSRWDDSSDVARVLGAAEAAIVIPPAFAWMAAWIGLRVRRHGRAVIIAIVAAVGWSVGVGLLLLAPLLIFEPSDHNPIVLFLLLSPVAFVGFAESGEISRLPGGPWVPQLLACAVYAGVWWYFRSRSLRNADDLLRRDGPT